MTARHPNVPPELRLPPHSIEAEQSLIGALLLDNSAWDRIADIVRIDDLYRDDNRRILRHIQELIEAQQPADVVTVYASIEMSNEVDQTGGMAYLGEIANATPSAANIRRYAEIIRETVIKRQLISIGDQIASTALASGQDARTLLDIAERSILELAQRRAIGSSGPNYLNDALNRYINVLQVRYERGPDELPGLPTGFTDLDRLLQGLQPGDLVIVAGRPSMGKTTMAMNIVEHVTMAKVHTYVASLEMTEHQLTARLFSSVAGIPGNQLKTGQLKDEEWDKATVAMGKLDGLPLAIDDRGGIGLGELRSRIRRVHSRRSLGLIVVDYLQLLIPERQRESRAVEVADISGGLKSLAKELQLPIIALSQLSRKVEERNDKRPVMSDLRDSGAIEQDADIILLMYRDEYYKPDTNEKGVAEVIVGKHRNGETGTIKLAFHGELSRFDDLAGGLTEQAHATKCNKSGSGNRIIYSSQPKLSSQRKS